jgi:hypothetical protein
MQRRRRCCSRRRRRLSWIRRQQRRSPQCRFVLLCFDLICIVVASVAALVAGLVGASSPARQQGAPHPLPLQCRSLIRMLRLSGSLAPAPPVRAVFWHFTSVGMLIFQSDVGLVYLFFFLSNVCRF